MSGQARRRWIEEEAPPPADLRLATPALAVWAGCLIALWAGRATAPVAAAIAIALAAVGGRAVRSHRRAATGHPRASPGGGARSRTPGVVAALVCLAAGLVVSALRLHAAATDPLVQAAGRGDWATIEMVLTADPSPVRSRYPLPDDRDGAGTGSGIDEAGMEGRWRVSGVARAAEARGATLHSRASVTIFGDGAPWSALATGQTVRVQGVIAPDRFSALDGVALRAVGVPQVISGPAWWLGWAVAARAGLVRSAGSLDDDRGGLLRGLVVGDTAGIGPQLSLDAKATGLTHLVAVSGSHMAIVSGVVLLMLRRTGPRIAAGGAAATLFALVVLVGPAPSVLRSVVMGVIGLAAAVLGRSRSALSGLAAAVFVLLLMDPALAVSAGFALSVQATAGLILLAPPWVRALRKRGVPRGLASLLVLPVTAHLATMPVIASISGTISLAAIPANIVVAPVIAPALLVGLGCAAIGPWWPAGGMFLARLDAPLLGWITGTAHRLARWPAATVPWPASPAGVLTLAGLLVAGLMLLRLRLLRGLIFAAAAGALAILIPGQVVPLGWPVSGWLLTACEVGQGDGLVLSTGVPGTAVVVDTGPDPALMDACLRRLGVSTVPLLVVTHLHADHVGGLRGVLGGRSVGAIGVGPDRVPGAAWQGVLAAAASAGVPVHALTPGTRWRGGDLDLTVLAPGEAFHGTESDVNNDSVVMMAVDRGVRILLAGDIEEPAQRALLDSGVDLHAEVLKQPHHGSAAILPEFLAAVSPRLAVIGVGAGNDYGHPSAAALTADSAAGVTTILRTDTDGDVQVCLTDSGLTTAVRGPSLRGPAPVARPSGG